MDLNVLATQFPNLLAFLIGIWYLMQQNKKLQEDLTNAMEQRLKQTENVIQAMNATTTAMTAQATALATLTGEVRAFKCGGDKA